MSFCPIGSIGFGIRSHTYALLSLDDNSCPAGSQRVIRHIDAEDDSPSISSTTAVTNPANLIVDSSKNVDLRFCVFPGSGGNGAFSFPNLGFSYGIFAASDFPGALATGTVFSDDEDTNNNDYWIWPSGQIDFSPPAVLGGVVGGLSDTGFLMAAVR